MRHTVSTDIASQDTRDGLTAGWVEPEHTHTCFHDWTYHSDDVTVMMSQQCAGTYSCAGCSLFGLFCEERQHQLHLLFLLLTDVVRVCRRTTHNTESAAHTSYHHSSCHRFSACVPPVHIGGYGQKFKSSQNWKQRPFLKLCFTKDTLICCN